jgi:hypothetical protein
LMWMASRMPCSNLTLMPNCYNLRHFYSKIPFGERRLGLITFLSEIVTLLIFTDWQKLGPPPNLLSCYITTMVLLQQRRSWRLILLTIL